MKNLEPLTTNCLCLSNKLSFQKTNTFTLWSTAAAIFFCHLCDHSLLAHTVNYISSVHICLPMQWPVQPLLINNEMSSKTKISSPSHQLHFILSHPPTLQWAASWLPFINNVFNSYYSLDYISPHLSPWHFPPFTLTP